MPGLREEAAAGVERGLQPPFAGEDAQRHALAAAEVDLRGLQRLRRLGRREEALTADLGPPRLEGGPRLAALAEERCRPARAPVIDRAVGQGVAVVAGRIQAAMRASSAWASAAITASRRAAIAARASARVARSGASASAASLRLSQASIRGGSA